jgi:hypothetical protein
MYTAFPFYLSDAFLMLAALGFSLKFLSQSEDGACAMAGQSPE